MWLLAELYETLPEAGDLDKPKLVFFFDEAHLLFTDASKAFLERIEQTVKLIRSKGVGVFFCTQLPTDVPNAVLSQLGARVQHALRAFTPEDQAALAKTVKTYPNTKNYDMEEALTSLGIGEAIVTVLSERGAPTPVAWTRMRSPRSLMAAIGADAVSAAAHGSPLYGKYGTTVDRESAYEKLTAKIAEPPPGAPAPRRGAALRPAAAPGARRSRGWSPRCWARRWSRASCARWAPSWAGRSPAGCSARGGAELAASAGPTSRDSPGRGLTKIEARWRACRATVAAGAYAPQGRWNDGRSAARGDATIGRRRPRTVTGIADRATSTEAYGMGPEASRQRSWGWPLTRPGGNACEEVRRCRADLPIFRPEADGRRFPV